MAPTPSNYSSWTLATDTNTICLQESTMKSLININHEGLSSMSYLKNGTFESAQLMHTLLRTSFPAISRESVSSTTLPALPFSNMAMFQSHWFSSWSSYASIWTTFYFYWWCWIKIINMQQIYGKEGVRGFCLLKSNIKRTK